MATITRCDGGCGKESPLNGQNVSRSWILMKKTTNDAIPVYSTAERIFCSQCWRRIEDAIGYKTQGEAKCQ